MMYSNRYVRVSGLEVARVCWYRTSLGDLSVFTLQLNRQINIDSIKVVMLSVNWFRVNTVCTHLGGRDIQPKESPHKPRDNHNYNNKIIHKTHILKRHHLRLKDLLLMLI